MGVGGGGPAGGDPAGVVLLVVVPRDPAAPGGWVRVTKYI